MIWTHINISFIHWTLTWLFCQRMLPHRCQTEQRAGQFPVVSGGDNQPQWVDILWCSGGILTDFICASKFELWHDDYLETNNKVNFCTTVKIILSKLFVHHYWETFEACGFIHLILKDNHTYWIYKITKTLEQVWAMLNMLNEEGCVESNDQYAMSILLSNRCPLANKTENVNMSSGTVFSSLNVTL